MNENRDYNANFTRRQHVYLLFKRLLDLLFSLTLLILLTPFFVIIAIIVLFDTKGFPVFRQRRYGKNGKPFTMLKFRSMKKNAPDNVFKEELDNPCKYITRFGLFLRKSSIDELPQLFNVFVGQMSIIGPRPILCAVSDWKNEREKTKAWALKPGITGLAQCSGRDRLSVTEKVKMDSFYANNISLGLDIKIFGKSIKNVVTKKDVVEGKQS